MISSFKENDAHAVQCRFFLGGGGVMRPTVQKAGLRQGRSIATSHKVR